MLIKFFLSLLFEKSRLLERIEMMDALAFASEAKHSSELGLFSYKDPLVKELVWNVKYKKNISCIRLAAAFLYEEIVSLVSEQNELELFTHPLIIAIPSSTRRRRERGYDHMQEIIKEISRLDTVKLFEIDTSLLLKRIHTERQTKLTKNQRTDNLKGVFSINTKKSIEERNIILIDDVITTGATMREATRILEEAGSRKVICVAFAH